MQSCNTEMSGGCCSSGAGKMRRFLTKDERVDMLKEYQKALELEAKGVSEKIATLKED